MTDEQKAKVAERFKKAREAKKKNQTLSYSSISRAIDL